MGTARRRASIGVTRQYPFVNLARCLLSVTVTVQPIAVTGVPAGLRDRSPSIRPEPVLQARQGGGGVFTLPGYRDLGRCSGNHFREPPCKLPQAPQDISSHGFRRSSGSIASLSWVNSRPCFALQARGFVGSNPTAPTIFEHFIRRVAAQRQGIGDILPKWGKSGATNGCRERRRHAPAGLARCQPGDPG